MTSKLKQKEKAQTHIEISQFGIMEEELLSLRFLIRQSKEGYLWIFLQTLIMQLLKGIKRTNKYSRSKNRLKIFYQIRITILSKESLLCL
jgi:hypothetical protein